MSELEPNLKNQLQLTDQYIPLFRAYCLTMFGLEIFAIISTLINLDPSNHSLLLFITLLTFNCITYLSSYKFIRTSQHLFFTSSMTLLFLISIQNYGMHNISLALVPCFLLLAMLIFKAPFNVFYSLVAILIFPVVGVGDLLGWWQSKAHSFTTWNKVWFLTVLNLTSLIFFYLIFQKVKSHLAEISEKNRIVDEMNLNLNQTIAEQTKDLQESNQELLLTLEQLQSTQDKLIQASKNESLAEIVAGVAHEMNTPIGVALTATSHLRDEAKKVTRLFKFGQLKKSQLEHFLNLSIEATQMSEFNLKRSSELVVRFKELSTQLNLEEVQEIFLADYLTEVINSLTPELKHYSVDIYTDFEINPYLKIQSVALWQIITNLVRNSIIHGFEGKSFGQISLKLNQDSHNFILEYTDNGKGISPSILPRIFEPFFTTKRGSGGTGLGLSIIYNLVTQTLNGQLECKSNLGEGVNFTIKIPRESGS